MGSGFEKDFLSLTGFLPMRWQRRLFDRFVSNDLPDTCDIPTGLGKTSVIVVWLLALAEQTRAGQVYLPRRLAYVVNRRTVVDQATSIVEGVRRRLLEPTAPEWQQHEAVLNAIATSLRKLCALDGNPLAVSTLRGELADNEEWKTDPSRAAIVVGTIDMIGSKLLFSGYGDGAYNRTHHAGLIGQDTLLIHDEAHLTPAFGGLLRALAADQHGSDPRPIQVIELSATSRKSGEHVFVLNPDDEQDKIVRERLTAVKALRVHRVSDDSVAQEIVEISKTHEKYGCRVLIYLRTPDRAREVASALVKSLGKSAANRIGILTGTIRGHERDQLVKKNQVYRAFLDAAPVSETVYLVSTSAGEVGIDLDADHLICDLTTLDSMIQRLGRVNRRGGEGRSAKVDIVGGPLPNAKPGNLNRAINRTLALARLARRRARRDDAIDVSPGNLRILLKFAKPEWVEDAFSPKSKTPSLTDILLDSWSLTSIDTLPGRPEVEPFLHGLTADPPETFVAWRREISLLHSSEVDEPSLREWFRACRIEAGERVRDRTDHVRETLADLLKRHRKKDNGADFPVVVLDERGRAGWYRLSETIAKEFKLAFRTVVLPVEASGLSSHGTLDATIIDPPEGLTIDVAEAEEGSRRERWLHRQSPEHEQYERLLIGEISDHIPAHLREKEQLVLLQPGETEEQTTLLELLLLVAPAESSIENPESASGEQRLTDHIGSVVAKVRVIADCVNLPEPKEGIRSALIAAAQWHDRGKNRAVWQRYARNKDLFQPLAKSKSYLHPRALGGYRHEFGSLLDASADEKLHQCPERDLVLHLIAAHHGWARPHFEPRAFDNTHVANENTRSAYEVMRRFEQLQQRFGRWGLAWLESLLRSADIMASREALPPASPPPDQEGSS